MVDFETVSTFYVAIVVAIFFESISGLSCESHEEVYISIIVANICLNTALAFIIQYILVNDTIATVSNTDIQPQTSTQGSPDSDAPRTQRSPISTMMACFAPAKYKESPAFMHLFVKVVTNVAFKVFTMTMIFLSLVATYYAVLRNKVYPCSECWFIGMFVSSTVWSAVLFLKVLIVLRSTVVTECSDAFAAWNEARGSGSSMRATETQKTLTTPLECALAGTAELDSNNESESSFMKT